MGLRLVDGPARLHSDPFARGRMGRSSPPCAGGVRPLHRSPADRRILLLAAKRAIQSTQVAGQDQFPVDADAVPWSVSIVCQLNYRGRDAYREAPGKAA